MEIHWKDAGAVGALALADPLSEILRALDVGYVRAAYGRVMMALAENGISTKKLRFGWLRPGYSFGGEAPSTPFDWTGWITPDLLRWPLDKQQRLFDEIARGLPPGSPRLVGQSADMRAYVADVAPDDAEAVLEAIVDSGLEEPSNWCVGALQVSTIDVDPGEPWWRAARAREAQDQPSLEAAITDAKKLYSAAAARIVETTFRIKWDGGLLT
jgi:hypothetical protein